MNKQRFEKVAAAIEIAWSPETSANPDWSPDNRALGQCAVTACVLSDYFGGDILNTIVTLPDGATDSHYYNVIDDEEFDLTRRQFRAATEFSVGEPATKEDILSDEPTRVRYELLGEGVRRKLDDWLGFR